MRGSIPLLVCGPHIPRERKQNMASIPKKVADRLIRQVGRFQRVLQKAKDRDVNESDTVTVVTDMLAGVFGYDKYLEVTSEQAILQR